MNKSTLLNLIWTAVWFVLGLVAIIGAIYCSATHQYFIALACFFFARLYYTDDEYGVVSVREYFKSRYKKD